jgi:hypothetical protein
LKTLLIIIAVLLLNVSTSLAQRQFTFKINEKDYKIEEQALNDLFSKAFTDLINQKWTEEKYFGLWTDTFLLWKDAAVNYQYSFTTYGERLSNYNIVGNVHYYYLGYDKPGKSAKGNPNKKDNFPKRVNVLTYALGAQIVYYCTKVYVK